MFINNEKNTTRIYEENNYDSERPFIFFGHGEC